MPWNIIPIPDPSAARTAGVPQRQDPGRHQARSVRAVRHRREGSAEGGARVRESLDQRDRRRGPQPGRVAQCHGEYSAVARDLDCWPKRMDDTLSVHNNCFRTQFLGCLFGFDLMIWCTVVMAWLCQCQISETSFKVVLNVETIGFKIESNKNNISNRFNIIKYYVCLSLNFKIFLQSILLEYIYRLFVQFFFI